MTSRPKPSHLRLVEGSGRAGSARGSRPSEAQPSTLPEPSLTESTPSRRGRAHLEQLLDGEVVAVARTGDRNALEVLYRRHAAFAIQLATRIEGSARDVEDVVHDAFIKAFSRLDDLQDPAAFRSWLGSIVVFAVRSRLRRQRLMNLLGLGRGADPVELDSLTSPEASPHTRAQLAQIYALLRTLPTDERIAWTLRHVEGHELEMVAKLTDRSLATVKRRISAAQRFLESHFVATERLEEARPTNTGRETGGDPDPGDGQNRNGQTGSPEDDTDPPGPRIHSPS
ncbi:MAG: sigma-70 family RNA polymerase sigma factor [Myxococcales bacterium]|nr:sigma-70 family RNA polymerase sigma factor [Myxococcales bacterium]